MRILLYYISRFVGGTRFTPSFAGYHTILLKDENQILVETGFTFGISWTGKVKKIMIQKIIQRLTS